ncbi:MAG: SIS domain-containing protein, partial [Ignavibacteriae bacterium]|nr:SIS domain-containing protein [Ignavibacteriota bacterium]
MSIILEELNSHLNITKSFIENCSDEIAKISDLLISTIQNGKKIILFGNGGSAADAQH